MKGNVTLEQTQELHRLLQGENPKEIKVKPFNLDPETAFRIIWYLQERLRIIPDNYEMCSKCKEIYDSYNGGGRVFCKNYCDGCEVWPDIEGWEYGSCEGCHDEGLCPFNPDNRDLMYFSNIFAEICEDTDKGVSP